MNNLRGGIKLLIVGGTGLEIGLKHHEQHYGSNYLGSVHVVSVPLILTYSCGTLQN
jgi:hypothetical protein